MFLRVAGKETTPSNCITSSTGGPDWSRMKMVSFRGQKDAWITSRLASPVGVLSPKNIAHVASRVGVFIFNFFKIFLAGREGESQKTINNLSRTSSLTLQCVHQEKWTNLFSRTFSLYTEAITPWAAMDTGCTTSTTLTKFKAFFFN